MLVDERDCKWVLVGIVDRIRPYSTHDHTEIVKSVWINPTSIAYCAKKVFEEYTLVMNNGDKFSISIRSFNQLMGIKDSYYKRIVNYLKLWKSPNNRSADLLSNKNKDL